MFKIRVPNHLKNTAPKGDFRITVIALYCCAASGPSSALYRLAFPSIKAPAGISRVSTGLALGKILKNQQRTFQIKSSRCHLWG